MNNLPMKTYRIFNLIAQLLLASALALGPILRAQGTAEPDKSNTADKPAVAPSNPPTKDEPAKPDAPEKSVVTAEAPASAPADAPRTEQPSATGEQKQVAPAAETAAAPAATVESESKKPAKITIKKSSNSRHHSDNGRISILHDSKLDAGESADAVVSILGSSTTAGEVSDAVVWGMG